VRRRVPEPDTSEFRADLAAGPDPEVWHSSAEWHAAGAAWATAHGLGPNGCMRCSPRTSGTPFRHGVAITLPAGVSSHRGKSRPIALGTHRVSPGLARVIP